MSDYRQLEADVRALREEVRAYGLTFARLADAFLDLREDVRRLEATRAPVPDAPEPPRLRRRGNVIAFDRVPR